jgi:ligand-binding sensor domain-containing protein/signal transduction histidine kinase
MFVRFALCAALFAVAPLPAGSFSGKQSGEYSERVWRTQDGLPQSRIQAITQTQDGYLWIGTSGGLVRFDGVRFVVFDRSNTAAFRDDSILSLCPARDGSLWIGAEGGGLLHYAGGSFRVFGRSEGLTNGFVRAIFEDSGNTLWVGADRGFFRLEGDRLVRLDGTSQIPFTAVTTIGEDRQGRIWLGASAGLLSVEAGSLTTHLSAGVRSILEMRDGAMLAMTSGALRKWQDGRLTPGPTAESRARVLYQDHEGSLWIGTAGEGLIRFRDGAGSAYQAPADLPANTILSLFEDREQNLWIGTENGLVRFSRKFVTTLTGKDGLAGDNVSTIYQDRHGTLWIATGTGQLHQMKDGRLSTFRFPSSAGNVTARMVIEDRDGVFWIGTAGQGIIRWSDGRARIFNTADGLRNGSIRAFHQDRRGNLWVATGSGLSRWNGDGFETYYIEDGLAYGSVRAIAEDRGGDLWIGTDGGLSHMRDGKFVHDSMLAELGSERILAIHEDSRGALWLGTRGRGLFRIEGGKLTNFTTRDGLPSNNIYQLLEDATGSLWMSSPAGVFFLSRKELDDRAAGKTGSFAVIAYGAADGMESSEMSGGFQPAGCWSTGGYLWFPSINGAVRIDPKQARASHPPPVVVEELIADERRIPASDAIRIPPGQGKLEIHYTAFNLLSPEQIRFKYRLEGFEDSWTETSTRRVAYYTSLPPGRYCFRVIASDVAAPQNTSEASLSFVWAPHFYQAGWFYGLYAILAGGSVWAAFRLYARQTRTRYALLLAERTRLAREMHDTVIQGCVGISTLLEAASGSAPSNLDMMRELLDRARAQVKLTLDEARQAVWDLRQGSLGGGVVGTLSEFTQQLSLEKNIPVETEITGAPSPLDAGTDRALLLVAREAVRNAVAHGHPRRIGIRLCFETAGIRMEVSDDGCGFATPPDITGASGHYGLVGMRERVEQLGGAFDLVSSPGQGTRVIARLPLPVRARHNGA